jgi:ribose 5-phosphate isomerase B
MKIALGADHAGFELKQQIKQHLAAQGVEVDDRGTTSSESVDYPDFAKLVGEEVVAHQADLGILVCGTGIGMAITANKVPGIRATVAHDSYSVERSVKSNNCQILTLGARVIGPELAKKLVGEWLGHEFDPTSASAEKVAVISDYEARTGRLAEDAGGCG